MEKHEIMTVQEVSEYLRVSERTVYEWATQGTIPAGRLGTAWRFKRSQVENWVDQHLNASQSAVSMTPVSIKEILQQEHIIISSHPSKDAALMEMVEQFYKSGAVLHKEKVAEGIFQREKLMSTGIGLGIAIPHVRMEGLDRLLMGIQLTRNPIEDYESLDGKPVQLIFMILAGKNQHALHIKTMAAISAKIKNPLLRASLFDAPDEQAIYRFMTEEG